MTEFDASYKRIFGGAEAIEAYLRYAPIPKKIFDSLDLSTLRKADTALVSDTLLQRHADSIWEVEDLGKSDSLYFVLHVEFQSFAEPAMALRMHAYTALLYENIFRRRKGAGRKHKLPTVLPVVLYTGKDPWTAPLEIRAFLNDSHSEVHPTFRYLLIDEHRLVQSEKAKAEDLAGALMQMRHGKEYDRIEYAIRYIIESESYRSDRRAYDELAKEVGKYRYGLEVATMEQFAVDLEDLENNIRQQGIEQGIEQGREQGIEQGREQGREQVARQMLNEGLSVRSIENCTGLTMEQIRAFRNGS